MIRKSKTMSSRREQEKLMLTRFQGLLVHQLQLKVWKVS